MMRMRSRRRAKAKGERRSEVESACVRRAVGVVSVGDVECLFGMFSAASAAL